MAPEQLARRDIDEQLDACGWVVQDHKTAAVAAAQGVAVRGVQTAAGPADYVLYVDGQAVGVIEAKRVGSTLIGVEFQTRRYGSAFPGELPAFEVDGVLPFGCESTGAETRFTSGLDPVPVSRRVFTFHRPETLAQWHEDFVDGRGAGLRAGVPLLPELDVAAGASQLWPAQADAICNLEQSFRENRPRALIQMATGSGKTFTAANVCYRLLLHAGAERVLFLVDRANLGRQALQEFQKFRVPDDGRKFSELYNVRHLTSSRLAMAGEAATKVHICTIQRLHSILRGDEADDYDESLDELSGFEAASAAPVEVAYNAAVPIESYDVIIVDECHRSICGVWRQVLEYFDAFLVGLTATPGIQTFGFFDQNLVMEYGHAQAVADRVNVDFDVFRVRTEITESGGTVPADFVTDFRDRDTREVRFERIDEDIDYDADELDKRVVAPDQIRTVVRTLHDTVPMERQRTVSFDKLLHDIGLGSTSPDVVSSLASRLTRLNRRMTAEDRAEVEKVAGVELNDLVREMVNALDVDRRYEAAAAAAGGDEPTTEQIDADGAQMIKEAVKPLAGNPVLREKLADVRRSYEQVIDTASKDNVISGEFSKEAADRAKAQVESWRQFIDDNKNEITALQVLYSQPRRRDLRTRHQAHPQRGPARPLRGHRCQQRKVDHR